MSLVRNTSPTRAIWLVVSGVFALLAVSCSEPAPVEEEASATDTVQRPAGPRLYSADWLIDAEAAGLKDVGSPYLYREVGNDRTGTYLVSAPNHLALQRPDEVTFCAAIDRLPLDPFCASSPRAEGAPHVLSYPIQLLKDWAPSQVYELASYREVSLVAASDTDNWSQRKAVVNDIAVECFTVTGETNAAAKGFDICFTDDDLHLVASVDLQSDLVFEIDLVSYKRSSITDDFETGLEEFFEDRPDLHEQLLDLYPEIPAARPTPSPNTDDG